MSDQLLIDLVLLTLIPILAVAAIEVRNLFAAIMLVGIYSLMMALEWNTLHAGDVAITEAAVGAGVSTVLFIGALVHVGRHEKRPRRRVDGRGLLLVIVTGGFLVYGTLDMPAFGDPKAPVHTYRVVEMRQQQVGKIGEDPASLAAKRADPTDLKDDFDGHVPNQVTAVLATYRSFDTMIEVTVILIAGISVTLLLRKQRRPELRP